ncbi:MAG: DEAD/DEAH box helicase family protein [Armatimonadetes bacterium]|nr:DEAD/DEAH box helicase family protein [Armatimonadota bacterium]
MRPIADPGQQEIPIQPVEKPILCSPFVEPDRHWEYDPDTGQAVAQPGRRPARYWYQTKEQAQGQGRLELWERQDELDLVNRLRHDVRRWRESGYEGASGVTKELLRYWAREDRPRRLFFCQLEAVETVLYLTEIRGERPDGRRGRPRFTPQFADADFDRLVDLPNEAGLYPLTRYGCKMATGSGKTVVMAMLIAWAFCNRGRVPSDERFPRGVLVCCPNLTVKERLQVLRPDSADNYYSVFDIVPARLRPLLQMGKVLVTNWHLFAPESEHAEGGKSWTVVQKGEESPEAFARRVLGELYDAGPLMVLNDEAHHAYRPAPLAERLAGEEGRMAQAEREEATVWISGLDRTNLACGIRYCVDLSATPFYLAGSGYVEGSPFPWLVSDFGLVDAIESGIVKIPRLPVNDTTGRPEARYFRLYKNIMEGLPTGDLLPGASRKPKPEALWREAEGALRTLAGQWKERFEYIQQASDRQDKAPPVLILVCDNTDIAQLFFENISGERQEEVVGAEPDNGEEEEGPVGATPAVPARTRGRKTRTVYGEGRVFPELFSNAPGVRRTVRIDTKLLAQAESEDPDATRQAAAQELRRIIATVGKPGEPGEHVRCVVSVAMLTEGWDANNVTHILGLRPFLSQLLCEQVVGRGLRRMDYAVNPATGMLEEEYVDVYGIPFSVIPFKGRATGKTAPEDRPKNHVVALEGREKAYEIRFPVVEGYAFALRKNVIRADIDGQDRLEIEPNREPTAVFVKPSIGYREGVPGVMGPGEFAEQNREEYYASTHLQTVEFEIARQIVSALVGDAARAPDPRGNARLRLQSRHRLFPQVLRIVDEYVSRKVDFHDAHPCELGLERYVQRVVERLLAAIVPDEDAGEPPLLPILNRYKPTGTTREVDFKTTRRCQETQKSHINQVVADTGSWEQAAVFRLEQSPMVQCYARNEQMGLLIPYDFGGHDRHFEPDFVARLTDGRLLIVEVKGFEDDEDRAKYAGARRWCAAVNNHGQLGTWRFHPCRDPQLLGNEVAVLASATW